MENKKKYPLSFYLVTVLAPFVLFALLEVILRIAGYAKEQPVFITVPGSEERLMMLNPDFTRRYFLGSEFVPHSINDVFLKTKDPNTLRVFVLGESSAAGFPYEPNGSFSRFLNLKLKLSYPQKKFEVVNLGIAAINSYAILDILDELINQKPDLVLVYTGHNEYYGALGAASQTSIAASPAVTRFLISAGKLRVMKLIGSIFSSSSGSPSESEGLMELLAKDKLIPMGSDLYNAGLDQFKHNLSEIFSKLKTNNIPVIVGTLVSNLADQPPFYPELSGAGKAWDEARQFSKLGKYNEAAAKYLEAKELDELRFRAPKEFNNIIKETSSYFGAIIVNVDSVFAAKCENGIQGKNLLVDHLHPNLKGYNLLADIFLNAIVKAGSIKESPAEGLGSGDLDSLVWVHFPFTKLDSLIAEYRLAGIMSQWPFVRSGKKLKLEDIKKPTDYLDSLAIASARGEIKWDEAHKRAAQFFIRKDDPGSVEREFRVLIAQFHYLTTFYDMLADAFLQMKLYPESERVLKESHAVKPGAFATKWLGILALNDGKAEAAKRWFTESLNYNGNDAQTLYNLAGAFINLKDFSSAKIYIQKCIQVEPNFPGARQLAEQLKNTK